MVEHEYSRGSSRGLLQRLVRLLLGSQRVVPLEFLKLTSLVGRQLVFAELDHDLLQRARELERHLRVVLVNDWRAGVHPDVKTLVEGKLAQWTGLLDAPLAHGLAIDDECSLASLAETTAVVDEIKSNGVLARRELVGPDDAGLDLALLLVLCPVLVGEGAGETRVSVEVGAA